MTSILDEKPNGTRGVSTLQLTIYIVIAVVGWAISGVAGYSTATSTMQARVAVLESQYQDVQRRLTSIEAKIDELLRDGK